MALTGNPNTVPNRASCKFEVVGSTVSSQLCSSIQALLHSVLIRWTGYWKLRFQRQRVAAHSHSASNTIEIMRVKIPTAIKTPFGLWSKKTANRKNHGEGAGGANSGPEVDGSRKQNSACCSHEPAAPATLSSGSLFEHQKSVITDASRAALVDYSINGLGIDMSSEYFMKRKKAMAHAIVVKGQVFCLQTDWFIHQLNTMTSAEDISALTNSCPRN